MSEKSRKNFANSAFNPKTLTDEERKGFRAAVRFAGSILIAIAITLVVVGIVALVMPDALVTLPPG